MKKLIIAAILLAALAGAILSVGPGADANPDATFTQVSAGGAHTCGLKTDGTLVCWGHDEDGQATPPAGTFTQVSAGAFHTCGVKTDRTLACWGNDEYGQAPRPVGSFTQVSAGLAHTCGVKTDGTVACWGDDSEGQATPPSGKFTQVSAGGAHTCGVKTSGTLDCWGNDEYGQATPPAGTFTQVSAGWFHTCGVKTDGTLACWGNDDAGQATPSVGSFTQASAGALHTCGVKTDGTVACWGDNSKGQATPPKSTSTPTPTPSPTPSPTPGATVTPTPPAGATRTLQWGPGWHNDTWTGAGGTSPADAFACADGSYAAAYRFTDAGLERYFPDRPDISDMAPLAQYDTFLILVTQPVTCTMPVAAVPSATRTLQWGVGWQNDGWTGADGTAPGDAFACADGNYAAAYRFTDAGLERYFPDRPDISNMGPLNKYDAFLILVTAPVTCSMAIAP